MQELESLQALASLSATVQPDVVDVVRACEIISHALDAEDAYVIRAGDPAFVRLGCNCPPHEYEIKQKGYWFIWRAAAAHPEFAGGLFTVEDRIASPAVSIAPSTPATHFAAGLPAEESNSELLIIRGPWPEGLTEDQVRFIEVARAVLARLVSSVLDRERSKRQRDQLESLASIATAFSEARANEDVLDAVATALAKASGFDWVTMNIYDEECRRVVERAMNIARHSDTDTAKVFRDGRAIRQLVRGSGSTELFGIQLAQQGGAALLRDVFDASHDEEPEMTPLRPIIAGLRKYWERAHVLSAAMFPIVFQDKVIGDLSYTSATHHACDNEEVEFLKTLTSQAATTIRGMRLYGDLEKSRERLRASEERFRSLVQNASDLVTVIDADTTITYQSPSITRLLGYQPEEVVGRRLSEMTHIDDLAHTLALLNGALTEGSHTVAGETRLKHRDGSWRDVEFIGSDLSHNCAIGGIVLNVRDVTERKALEQQLRHQALHDPLTKLANRTRFADRLEHALTRAERSNHSVSVLFMDLDNFKGVNDSLGHSAGDLLLTQVAERAQACLRPGDTVARLGGDEFAVLIEDVISTEDAIGITGRIFEGLRAPFQLEGKDLAVRASIGIATSDANHRCEADALLRDADVAMYAAKAQGKGCYRVFEPSMQVSMMKRLELLADLQRALERDEFVLEYQPMILLQSGELAGMEALVRWNHPQRGLLPPAEFIALAEESGAILRLGNWVLTQACRQAREWFTRYRGGNAWSMSVNVSVKQLQDPAFSADVARALNESQLDPCRLILEITESVMMQDTDLMMKRLLELKAIGVRLAIDDFGTGYSSLSYLREFPFDLLKIDKSFIDDVGGAGHKELTKAIIGLGKTLDLELVAEGIEQSDQLSRLQSMQCEIGQGFLFAKPLDVAAVNELLDLLAQQSDAAA